jgi:hypothetical protein
MALLRSDTLHGWFIIFVSSPLYNSLLLNEVLNHHVKFHIESHM